ncbi:HalOD1 output domain-containing protein [Halobacterium zhouii]|uniref:HalOD1 output domain-containing protein n=1 Tax=Halobacterium zhouii TaxID=2902624 RepID=UPI001E2998AC|nr:HalOD1 output domain-containing protein [Halobacterium zhouii]
MTATIDLNEGPVSQHVVEKVSEVTDTDPTDLEPLFNTVDPDSLNTLFSDIQSASPRDEGHVAFPIAGCQVTIWADGRVEVEENDEAAAVTPDVASEAESSSAPEPTD